MTKWRRPRFVTLAALSGLTLAVAGCETASTAGGGLPYESPVKTHPSQGKVRMVDGAAARLVTTQTGAYVNLKTRGLEPGHAYTLWWVVVNNPAACKTSPCKPPDVLKRTAATNSDVGYADGLIAGADGEGAFSGFLAKGKLPNAWYGNGLRNPEGAEIHLVINDHGPLIPRLARTMLHSYRGGCMDKGLPKVFPASARSDGAPGPNKCKLVQVAIFQQKR